MATPPTAPTPTPPPAPAPEAAAPQTLPLPVILATMLRAGSRVSDLIFSPARLPQVELSGELVPAKN